MKFINGNTIQMNYKLVQLYLIGLIFSSCSSNNEMNKLKSDLERVQKINKELHTKLDNYKNSILIDPKELNEYLIPVTFGPMVAKKNEPITFETHLVLRKLPENIKVNWKSTPEAMSIKKNSEIPHYLENVYENSGKREFNGTYELTFPNGTKKMLYWFREFEIK